MSANENEILTGLEPYRDPFQVLISYGDDEDEYLDAQSRVYDELNTDIDVSRTDQLRVMRMISNGNPENAYQYLGEDVLEEQSRV